jgi:hypothetical protein
LNAKKIIFNKINALMVFFLDPDEFYPIESIITSLKKGFFESSKLNIPLPQNILFEERVLY